MRIHYARALHRAAEWGSQLANAPTGQRALTQDQTIARRKIKKKSRKHSEEVKGMFKTAQYYGTCAILCFQYAKENTWMTHSEVALTEHFK